MSTRSESWNQFCATIAAYRRKHRSWPNRAMVPRQVMEEVERHLGPENFAKVHACLRLFPSNTHNILVYDEQCQIVDAPDDVTFEEMEEVQRWLGVDGEPGA